MRVSRGRGGVAIAALVLALGLTAFRMRSVVVVLTNDTHHPLDHVTLHLPSQQVPLGTLASGETRRTWLWRGSSAGLTVTHRDENGTRQASLGYLYTWHAPFEGTLLARVATDSVTIRQRLDRSRRIVPRWREYSVPLHATHSVP